ncbi:hypothetical protein, partial [Thiohalocapsa sp.]|uniref:hypothetical protein n=1 Tax=Thiohalocapsa sp. TaxID=2497641 RepID=UPI0025FE26BB
MTIILSCLAVMTALGVQAEDDAAGPDFVALDGDRLGRLVDAHTSERIGELLAGIASLGSRAPGAGNLPKTADWLSERIEQAGWEVLPRQPFRLAVPVDTGSELTYRRNDGGDMRVRLHPVWPNRTLCPFIPGGCLRAELVYVGDGDLSDFDGHEAFAPGAGVDAVALMEYDSGVHWETAAMLGARAVVFLPDADATSRENENKFAASPVQVPRFYVADEIAADELREQAERGGSVTIAGGMQWQNRGFENVLALLPATESSATAETLLVTVRYDASRVVPGASPGGRRAAELGAEG